MGLAANIEDGIYEANEWKRVIEISISELISGFEKNTGLQVNEIIITKAPPVTACSKSETLYVKLELAPIEIK